MTELTTSSLEARINSLEKKFEILRSAETLRDLSNIYPKENIVLFIGRDYFGDNIKYAFLDFYQKTASTTTRCYYLTDDLRQKTLLTNAGLPHLSASDPQSFPILLAAKIVVLCDLYYPQDMRGKITKAMLSGAKVIQLWHGIPLKEIGLTLLSHVEMLAACGPFDALIASNAASEASWARRFSFKKFMALGHPRNDVLKRKPTIHDLMNVDSHVLSRLQTARLTKRPILLYAPTFRDNKTTAWLQGAGLDRLAEVSHAKGYEFIVNLHPFEQSAITELRQRHPKVMFVEPHTDIYPILSFVDALITDYSSLAFDFLALDRPILFYRPDHNEYITQGRPLIPNRDHYTCGVVSHNVEELLKHIDETVEPLRTHDMDPWSVQRQALRSELFDHNDDQAAERVSQLIQSMIG